MKAFKFIVLAILFLNFAGCEEHITNEPKDFISPSNFFNNDSDARTAINGVYSTLAEPGLYGHPYYYLDSATDNIKPRPTASFSARAIGEYIFTSEFGLIEDIWGGLYRLVNRSNEVIANLRGNENVTLSVRDRIIGEALFMRAFAYYNLVALWGPVPLLTEPSEGLDALSVRRSSEDLIWEQIIDDAEEAIQLLPEKPSLNTSLEGRVGKAAARTLLAKSLMWQQDWSGALTQVDVIITSGKYELEEDPADVFKVANENGKESIFEVQFGFSGSGTAYGSTHPQLYGPAGGSPTRQSFSGFVVVEKFFQAFEDQDLRKQEWIWEVNRADNNNPFPVIDQPHNMKYYDPDFNVGQQGYAGWSRQENNFIVFRMADVWLMKAEIENQINPVNDNAVEALNRVRERANASLLTNANDITQDEFRELIFQERAKELFGENYRLFELKRRGFSYYKEKVENRSPNAPSVEGFEHFPIPQSEIELNPALEEPPLN